MSKDYYQSLGVQKDASESDIKKAFYKLAQKHHPDKPGGDEGKFKEINEAYQVLSNKEKRAQYDRFGSAGPNMGGGAGGAGYGGFGGFGGFQGGAQGFDFNGIDLEDILSQFGMGGFGGFGGGRARKGKDAQMHLELSFKEAALGVEKEIEVPDLSSGKSNATKKVKVQIPPGVEEGQRVRLEGYGYPLEGAPAGNLYLSILIKKHPTLEREGVNLIARVTVKLSQAVLGDTITVDTLDGTTDIKIPAGMQPGQILRVRAKGIPTVGMFGSTSGDLLIVPTITIPKKLSKKAKEAMEVLKEEGV